MKPTHLITLSEYIDYAIKTAVIPARFMAYVEQYNNKLKRLVTLSDFVACDENGVPLEKRRFCPHPQEDQIKCSDGDHCDCDNLCAQYNEAQKSVIFEGWEVVRDEFYKESKIRVVRIKDQIGTELEFYYDENNKFENIDGVYKEEPFKYEYITTLADLAAATTKNPLKLI